MTQTGGVVAVQTALPVLGAVQGTKPLSEFKAGGADDNSTGKPTGSVK
jgi:hypothetical protein